MQPILASFSIFHLSISIYPLSPSLSARSPPSLYLPELLMGKYLEVIPAVPLVINTITYRTVSVTNQIPRGACPYPPVPIPPITSAVWSLARGSLAPVPHRLGDGPLDWLARTPLHRDEDINCRCYLLFFFF